MNENTISFESIRISKIKGLFCRSLSRAEIDYVLDRFATENWSDVIDFLYREHVAFGKKRTVISSMGIKLSRKLLDELGIDVFPIVMRTYAKRILKGEGAFVWTMLEPCMIFENVGGCWQASNYVKKGVKLSCSTSWEDNEIFFDERDAE